MNQDPATRRDLGIALILRTLAAVAIVTAAALLSVDVADVRSIGYGLAFLWIPGTVALDLVRRRRPSRLIGVVSDVAVVAGPAAVLLSNAALAEPALMTLIILVAGSLSGAHGHRDNAVSAAALSMAFVGAIVLEPATVDGGQLTTFAAAVVAIHVLALVSGAERVRTSRGLTHARRRTDAILRGVGEAVVVTSPRGRIRQWNQAAEACFSCPSEQAIGSSCAEMLALRRDVTTLDCSSECALLGDGDQEAWRLRPNGDRQPLLVTASAVRDAGGVVQEVVHSLRDITSIKRADEAKTLFLATASHELKTPLAVIQGFSGMMLADAGIPEKHRVGIDAIHRRSHDLARIVERLLMSSRIEAGRVQLSTLAADIVPLVEERVGAMRDARDWSIWLDVEPGIGPALVDPDAVQTIVDHLVDNAIKYSPDGEAIRVSVRQEVDRVVVEVADNGMGMSPLEAEKCFERFWQAESSDVRRFGGTGIGLYIVRSLVEAQQATITVESALGEGSRFRVSFVLASAANADEADEASGDTGEVPPSEPSIIKEFMRQVGVGGGAA